MAKLIHKNKTILREMKYITNFLGLGIGLTFASERKVKNGVCLVLPGKDKIRSITMLFCFHPLDIIFIDSNLKVVDKTTLKPWKINYTPKQKFKYAIETSEGSFRNVNINDKIVISL